MWPDDLPVRPCCKKGTDADLAAHPQGICAERTQPCRSSRRRQKCKQQEPRFLLQRCAGKQLHKQRPVSQPIEHRKQKDQNRPQCGKAHQEQKGRGRSQRKIFRSEKAGRSMCICSGKQAAPALQIILQPVRLLLFAESQKHTSCTRADQKGADEQPAGFLPDFRVMSLQQWWQR